MERFAQAFNKQGFVGKQGEFIEVLTLADKSTSWPLLLSKRDEFDIVARHTYAFKSSQADVARRDHSLDILIGRRGNPRTVVWTGCSGIGKSADLNNILTSLLFQLREGQPLSCDSVPVEKVVLYLDQQIFEFSRGPQLPHSEMFEVEVKEVQLPQGVEPVQQLQQHCDDHNQFASKYQTVAIVELLEKESMPFLRVPSITALSSRSFLHYVPKEQRQRVTRFLLDPWMKPSNLQKLCMKEILYYWTLMF